MNTEPLASPVTHVDSAAALTLLRRWLVSRLPGSAAEWLDAEIERQFARPDDQRLTIAIGLAARKTGRNALALGVEEIAEARTARTGWQPESWSTDEAARTALLLASHRGDDPAFAARLDRLCSMAEVTEVVAYMKGFAVFPAPALLHERAREGVRSAVQPVFEAIACKNPYPFDYFDVSAFNQMVVKCVFVGASIGDIVGIGERRNPQLVQMLEDLVAERRAAGRPIADAVKEYIA